LNLDLDFKNNVYEVRGLKKGASTAFALEEALTLNSENNLSVFLCDNYLSARDLYKNLTFFENALFLTDSSLKKKKGFFFSRRDYPAEFIIRNKDGKRRCYNFNPRLFFLKSSRIRYPFKILH
jgi:hypothetical protein